MKFTAAIALGVAALSSVAASPVPADSAVLDHARALYRRHFPDADVKLAKRNNGGGSSSGVTDVDILNFALNLEYLEAQYYHIAAYGTQLSQDLLNGKGNRGYVSNNAGNQVPFNSSLVKQYAVEIANDEVNHVKALRAALGDQAVAMPELNLGTSFTAAARAAGIIGSNETFSPYASDAAFLIGAFVFEDVGVTAYNGAAPLVQNKQYLAAAASILAVEAYHAGGIRANLIAANFAGTTLAATAANAISALRAKVGGGKDQGITVNGTANLVPANDTTSFAFARTPAEVLAIVYLGSASAPGGFFPNGLNGNIK